MSRFHWGWRIAIVYTIFATATLGFVFFALTQEVDLVREDYYQYSLDHDQRMQARAAATAEAEAVIEYQDGNIHVHLPAAHHQASGTVALYRPAVTSDDRSLPLVLSEGSVMSIPTADMAQGKWVVTVTWSHNGTQYEMERPIEVEG